MDLVIGQHESYQYTIIGFGPKKHMKEMVLKMDIEERGNFYTYAVFICIAVAGMVYGISLEDTTANIRVWGVFNLLVLLIGIPFIFLQSKARLPNFWEPMVTTRQRLYTPFFIGLVFGVLDVLVFKIILHPEPYTDLPQFLQPFPYSVFLYISGAFEVEVFYRLIPLTIFMLLGAYYKQGRYLDHFFWVGAILSSVREPLEQFSNNLPWVVAYALATGFLMNLLQAVYYRKAGFLSSITLRLGHYLILHILLGVYVEQFEIPLP